MAARPAPLVGVAFMVASGAVVAAMEAAVRGLSQTLHPFVIVFWREVFSTLLLLPLWLAAGAPRVARERLPLHGLRALLNGAAILAWYLALRALPLAEATALGFTAIPFAALAGGAVLGERVSPPQWIAIAAGLGGVGLIVGPLLDPGAVGAAGIAAALGSAVLFAASMLVAKLGARRDGSAVGALLLSLGMGALAGALAVPVWAWPGAADLGWLAFFGLCNVGGQVFFLEAMRRADAATIIPLDILRLAWALIFGAVVYAERPALPVLLGGLLVAASAVLVVLGGRREEAAATPSNPAAGLGS